MNKVLKLLSVLCAVVIVFALAVGSFNASAAIPTKLSFKQVSSAPAIDASIDSIYGSPVFDFSAKDTPIGEYNVFPRTQEQMATVMDAYNAMRVKGYVVFDKEYLYMAFDVNDVAPKVAGNSSKFYQSTNVQLVFYVNENLGYITAAYSGTNSVRVFNDDGNRSTMTIDNIDCKLVEKSKTNYIYEMRIPWVNFHEVDTLDDITDFKFAITQTSMGSSGTYKNANGVQDTYVCSAFGKAYDLNYDSCLPVTLQKLSNSEANKPVESQTQTQSQAVSSDAGAVGSGVDFGTNTESSDSESSVISSQTDADATTSDTENNENKKDYTLVIILAVVAVLVIGGGATAIILLNKGDKNK